VASTVVLQLWPTWVLVSVISPKFDIMLVVVVTTVKCGLLLERFHHSIMAQYVVRPYV